jgi:glycogen debranching enzyme
VATYRVRREGGKAEGLVLPEDALELRVDRTIGQGMLERWELANHSAAPWSGVLRFDLDVDFADVAEAGRERQQHGETTRRARGRSLEIAYTAAHGDRRFDRGVRIRLDSPPRTFTSDAAGFEVRLSLEARDRAEVSLRVDSRLDERWRIPGETPEGETDAARRRTAWRARRLRASGPSPAIAPVERAIEDLFALRNRDLERDLLTVPGARGWVINAGVPRFTGFFGRDALTAGWQAAMAGTDGLRGALEVAAATQASDDDPWRDAEPGKMIHELRRGPVSMLRYGPRDAYYGNQRRPCSPSS